MGLRPVLGVRRCVLFHRTIVRTAWPKLVSSPTFLSLPTRLQRLPCQSVPSSTVVILPRVPLILCCTLPFPGLPLTPPWSLSPFSIAWAPSASSPLPPSTAPLALPTSRSPSSGFRPTSASLAAIRPRSPSLASPRVPRPLALTSSRPTLPASFAPPSWSPTRGPFRSRRPVQTKASARTLPRASGATSRTWRACRQRTSTRL
mmetsp:Transcript_4831/g.15631  ORF Transcript_4831/g.15631 Transcript_4831/m.15631 type:complete len:203 (-) Transcript_4831:245-853(-)